MGRNGCAQLGTAGILENHRVCELLRNDSFRNRFLCSMLEDNEEMLAEIAWLDDLDAIPRHPNVFQNLFWDACMEGNFQVVEDMLALDIIDLHAQDEEALTCACAFDQLEVAELLLRQGSRMSRSKRPLWCVLRNNNIAMLRLLIRYHAHLLCYLDTLIGMLHDIPYCQHIYAFLVELQRRPESLDPAPIPEDSDAYDTEAFLDRMNWTSIDPIELESPHGMG